MGRKPMIWLGIFVALVGALGMGLRAKLNRTPISLAMTSTSRGKSGLELVIAVDRRDWLVGFSHGAPPTLSRAWLSDGQGRELPTSLLQRMTTLPPGTGNAKQFGWIVAPVIPKAPPEIVFHATFVAPGAEPFEFDQPLRAKLDFNEKEAP